MPLSWQVDSICITIVGPNRAACRLSRLRSLRLVRCSLTQQAAAALGRLTQLRRLCIAHADLAALPQLLASEAAANLEHIHVHGYHSLAIMDDNPHMRQVWRAAGELVDRSLGPEPATAAAAAPGDPGSGADASGRLQCLAVSAHHWYHDAVLDGSELEFEDEAAQWQIRYERRSSRTGDGDGGRVDGGGGDREALTAGRFGRGCSRDPHEDPDDGAGTAGRGAYAGGGSGGWALCAAALVGIRCGCCSAGADGLRLPTHPRQGLARGADSAGAGAGDISSRSVAVRPSARAPLTRTPEALGEAFSGPALAPPLAPAPSVDEARGAAEAAGLQVLRSAKRSVQLLPPEQLLAEVARPSWRHLQYIQLALTPGPAPPPPPTTTTLPGLRSRRPAAAATPVAAASGYAGCSHGTAGGGGGGAAMEVCGVTRERGRVESEPELGADVPPCEPPLQGDPVDDAGAGGPRLPLTPTLAALNQLSALRGIWLDPEKWEEETQGLGSVEDEPEDAEGYLAGCCGGAAEALRPSQPPHAAAGPGTGVADARRRRHRARWARVGDVWTRLHEHPPPPYGTGAAAAVQAPVQDLGAHAALLVSVTVLRSLALGRRRTSQTHGSVLGVGDDTAQLLSRLAGLTKLHLSAAYSLPLGIDDDNDGAAGRLSYSSPAPSMPPPPPRLAALGALTNLQRLALHFNNPLARPAVVSHAALPPSLTSLSLQGVVLVPPPPAAAASPGGGPLERLRELSLTSSHIRGANLLLGCAHRLRILSLRDSGLGLVPAAAGVTAADGRDLAWLLRRWHSVETLRVQGSTATSEAARLPAAGHCLNWHSTAGLRAIAACLPGLRQLHLAPPPAPPPPFPPCTGTLPRPRPGEAAAPPAGPGYEAGQAAVTAAVVAAGCTVPAGVSVAVTAPARQPVSVLGGADPQGAAERAGAGPSLLPDWRLTSSGRGRDQQPAIAAAAGVAGVATEAPDSDDPTSAAGCRPGGQAAQPHHTASSGTAAGPVRTYSVGVRMHELKAESESEFESGSEGWTEDAAETGARLGAGAEGATAVTAAAAPPQLATLLRLLCRAAPQLQVLRLSCTAPDRSAAERAARAAAAQLPGGLPALESLSLTLDIGLPYLLAQPQPEAAMREWAMRLRDVENELQARMRFTCVSVSPHPQLASRVREASGRALSHQAARPV